MRPSQRWFGCRTCEALRGASGRRGTRMRFFIASSMLCFLAVEACAAGVEMGERRAPRPDAGSDASRGAGSSGSGVGTSGSYGGSGSGASGSGVGGASGNGGAQTAGNGGGGGTDAGYDAVFVGDAGCVEGQKSCGGRCVVPEAQNGCTLLGCEPCPSPPQSYPHCTNKMECTFSCWFNYIRVGDTCVFNDGGVIGGGGAGGSD